MPTKYENFISFTSNKQHKIEKASIKSVSIKQWYRYCGTERLFPALISDLVREKVITSNQIIIQIATE